MASVNKTIFFVHPVLDQDRILTIDGWELEYDGPWVNLIRRTGHLKNVLRVPASNIACITESIVQEPVSNAEKLSNAENLKRKLLR